MNVDLAMAIPTIGLPSEVYGEGKLIREIYVSSSETPEPYSHRLWYFLKVNLPSFLLVTDPQGHHAEDL